MAAAVFLWTRRPRRALPGKNAWSEGVKNTLDDAVRHVEFAAKSWQPHNQFDGVDIVGNDNKLGLAGLHELGDVVETILNELRLLGVVLSLALLFLGGLLLKTLLLSSALSGI